MNIITFGIVWSIVGLSCLTWVIGDVFDKKKVRLIGGILTAAVTVVLTIGIGQTIIGS